MIHTAGPPRLALIASDEEWIARSLDSILAPNGYVVFRAYSGAEVLEHARSAKPDVFLLDAGLPDIGGVELCGMLRPGSGFGSTTPLIVTTTDPVTRDLRLAALRAGAWEFVGFPLDSEELLLRLEVYLAAKAAADTLRERSLVDDSTGFYNARGLLRRVKELGSEAHRRSTSLACVALAPDFGRPETEPQPAGGRETAEGLRSVVVLLERFGRTSDAIGRLGEYDFAVLAPDTDAAGAVQLAERLTRTAETQLGAVPGGGVHLKLRAGCYAVADFHQEGVEPIDLLVRATLALRQSQAERDGERVRLFGPPPSTS